MLATLGAPQRRLGRRRVRRDAAPGVPPAPVATGRATVIDVLDALADRAAGEAWLTRVGEPDLEATLNRALRAFRVAATDPAVADVHCRQALVARVG